MADMEKATAAQPSIEVKTPQQLIRATSSNERLSFPFLIRLPLVLGVSSFCGFFLGAAHGGSSAGLRFRAENTHRLPTTQVGWYLYHKSKNYHVMLGGIKEGLKMGSKLGFWAGGFFVMEEAVDRLRGAVLRRWVGFKDRRRESKGWDLEERDIGLERLGNKYGVWVQRDFISTTVAALGTAGAFSAWSRSSEPEATQRMLMCCRSVPRTYCGQDSYYSTQGWTGVRPNSGLAQSLTW